MSTEQDDDRVIYRPDLQRRLAVCGETMRRYIRDKKLPPPDVAMTAKKQGWRMSTLRQYGINLA